jgi:hypothetical protein
VNDGADKVTVTDAYVMRPPEGRRGPRQGVIVLRRERGPGEGPLHDALLVTAEAAEVVRGWLGMSPEEESP